MNSTHGSPTAAATKATAATNEQRTVACRVTRDTRFSLRRVRPLGRVCAAPLAGKQGAYTSPSSEVGIIVKSLLRATALGIAIGATTAVASAQVYVTTAPPAPIVETRPAYPGSGYTWVGG